ncbi:helix-turn-helix transcriptional regulator [bacterium 210820-DFI.6.37]|nr:helix-turn-helix transcriptional regulator [bacterium 210820-DFI.6.37]
MVNSRNETIKFMLELMNLQYSNGIYHARQLLELFEKYLGFQYTATGVYDSNIITSLMGPEIMSESKNEAILDINKTFVRPYIMEHRSEIMNDIKPVFSTDMARPENYEHSKYVTAMREKLGMYYSAFLAFREVYIVVYHTEEDGNFSNEEKNTLTDICRFMTIQDAVKERIRNDTNSLYLINEVLDDFEIGTIIFKGDHEVLYCNKRAIQYISSLCGEGVAMEAMFEAICGIAGFKDTINTMNYRAVSSGYEFTAEHLYKQEEYGVRRHYIRMTMVPMSKEIQSCQELKIKEAFERLTRREMDVIECLYRGMQYQDAADSMVISINTFRTHIRNIYKKLGINKQADILRYYGEFRKQ